MKAHEAAQDLQFSTPPYVDCDLSRPTQAKGNHLKTLRWIVGFTSISISLSACLKPGDAEVQNSTGSGTTTSTVPGGLRSARFIFSNNATTGSFTTARTSGGYYSATTVFNTTAADPPVAITSSGPSDTDNWPQWISNVQVYAPAESGHCARFAVGESSHCDYDGDTVLDTGESCSAPNDIFRVSEYDCAKESIANGTGLNADPIQIRVTFNRSTTYLGSKENIMAVLQYSSSVLRPAPAEPSTCFTGGTFDPTNANCSDMTWMSYLKKTTDSVQPFLMLVPPAMNIVGITPTRNSTGITTKQFFIPLSSDSDLTTFQLSRLNGLAIGATGADNFEAYCQDMGNTVGDSPFCVGMVFYSLSLFRI